MPRWIERRGFTLRLPPAPEVEPRHQVVRLSLVERRGLTGSWFNVREARAEPSETSSRTLAGGRALSWRALRQGEAERLLDQRLRTLQALGYELIDAALTGRGRWDWLYELVRRGLRPAAGDDAPAPGPALRDALEHIGLSPDAIVEGVATVLELPPGRLREPDGATVARVDPDQIGVLLPFLVEHGHAEIREIGERWVACPGAAFQVPRAIVERWLTEPGRMGDLLATRVRSEGLALVGPDALLRLSKASSRDAVRRAAEQWMTRLG
ncbi:hypothetical protein [Paraliomyxa miuraensis]|uniref:hypothetical protein n=1 Tax=Paraliomyxa miuraensis TaxID=376150 RepID=UPI00224DAE32|nr:hypothetical protein [Paraliomyxa miuraensis]MCX4246849.1 hypothetical protein [Paraliomyxa miuraensis]